jgi:transcriptional regulator with XRE-family HTH domain
MPDKARSCNAGLAGHIGEKCAKVSSATKADPGAAAFEAEIDLTYMGGIEQGKRNPSLLVMVRIADALGVQLPKLLSD